MLSASRALCTQVGMLLAVLCPGAVDGLIEIVEEQQCHNYGFRLTCRDIDDHIAILEAWYTTMSDYQRNANSSRTHESLRIKTENDSELDRVYVYSSPKRDGVYQSVTTDSSFENLTSSVVSDTNSNALGFPNDTFGYLDDEEDVTVEFLNVSDACSAVAFARSYGSWREGDKRRRPKTRESSSSINLRGPLSYRCSGVNHCNFVLAEDYPASVAWSPGLVYIKYACFDDTASIHYCNREVHIAESGPESEGYIRTPGYPNFYIGGECRWRLRVHPEQRVKITLLDVNLRSIGPFEDACTDYVSVIDVNGDVLLSSCEQVQLPLRIVTTTNIVDVIVDAGSKGAFPKRGLLLNYKSIDCITHPAPSNGYMVYRNEEVAHYVCNMNYVFADTRQRARLLWCYDDNRWNDTVPFCVEEASLTVAGNNSASNSTKTDDKLAPTEANVMVDIVIPSLLIAALFIGNAFIVLIIYKYRKRKTDDLEDEFNTIPLNGNGSNIHSAGNAV